MRKLLAVVLIAAAAYGGYWFVGATAVERGMRGWLAAQSDRGWTVDYDDLSTRGFPSRFDTTITDLTLGDPDTGILWQAPFFQILALAYRPTQIIAAFPDTQMLRTPRQDISIASDRMRASATFTPNTKLALDHSAVVADAVTLTGSDWSAAMEQLRFATRPAIGAEYGHDADLVAVNLRPAAALRDLVDPDGTLPETLETLSLDATLDFDAPLDRSALQGSPVRLTGVEISAARATWGALDLRLDGAVVFDAAGIPEGTLTLSADNWPRMVEMAVAAGLVPPGAADTARNALRMLASVDGDDTTLNVPIRFADGRLAVGPIDLGPAPRLR